MSRCIAKLLCLIALLVQVVTGALPNGEFCFGRCNDQPARDLCCCPAAEDGSDEPDRCVWPLRMEPGKGGCDRCVLIHTPVRETTVGQRITPDAEQLKVACVLPSGERLPCSGEPNVRTIARPRANESPPHLRSLNITRLIV